MTTPTMVTTTSPGSRPKRLGFVGAPSQAVGLSARIGQRIRRRTKPDRLLENFIFGFFRHGAQAALYVAAAYAAKIAFGIGHLSLSLK